MNKMSIFQRFWCLIVTVALLVAAVGIYPDSKRKAVQANGFETLPKTEFVAEGRAVLQYNALVPEHVTQPASALVQQPAVTKSPQASSVPSVKKNSPAKSPASITVAAPAPEQIITSLKVTATGYTAGYESTGKTSKHPEYGITYSGVKVRRDKYTVSTIAADPKVFPLGSILYIPGYGYGVVADTGSAIKGRKIDLYFSTTKQVYKEWGKKAVVVQLIKRGNGKCTEAMLKNLSRAIETYKAVPQSVLEQVI